jgi:glycosyltransferase involved in cell wall biosynthesis
MKSIAYYVPSIPDVWSTTRYQHALAAIEVSDRSILIGNVDPPTNLAQKATEVYNIDSDNVVGRARTAAEIVNDRLDKTGLFVTSFHYEAALSGFFTVMFGTTWTVDIFDAPAQYRFNNPRSHHSIASHGLEWILKMADQSIHTCHPETPFQYGQNRHFITNGSPISRTEPHYRPKDELSIVWAGSPQSDRGGAVLAEALSQTNERIQVDAYGEADDQIISLVEQYDIADQFNFHGWVPHNEVLSAICQATIGFAVLPPRNDWRYATPIKIGEYLAGGTIPLVSDYPGSRYVAADSGIYVQPNADAISDSLSIIHNLSDESQIQLMRGACTRGEEISWGSIRSQFTDLLTQVDI